VLLTWFAVASHLSNKPQTDRWHVYSDSAVKQILLTMNEKDPFVIEDLDDYHLVIKADEEYRVRRELEAEV
jgi:TFIIH basal transcription factor complex TTD-A subunit